MVCRAGFRLPPPFHFTLMTYYLLLARATAPYFSIVFARITLSLSAGVMAFLARFLFHATTHAIIIFISY
jgi:hypothetical protein